MNINPNQKRAKQVYERARVRYGTTMDQGHRLRTNCKREQRDRGKANEETAAASTQAIAISSEYVMFDKPGTRAFGKTEISDFIDMLRFN